MAPPQKHSADSRNGMGMVLQPLLEEIFFKDGKAEFFCDSGGAFVLPGVEHQFLPGDVWMSS